MMQALRWTRHVSGSTCLGRCRLKGHYWPSANLCSRSICLTEGHGNAFRWAQKPWYQDEESGTSMCICRTLHVPPNPFCKEDDILNSKSQICQGNLTMSALWFNDRCFTWLSRLPNLCRSEIVRMMFSLVPSWECCQLLVWARIWCVPLLWEERVFDWNSSWLDSNVVLCIKLLQARDWLVSWPVLVHPK